MILYFYKHAVARNLKEIVIDHARYREQGPHYIEDTAPTTVQRVVNKICRAAHPDRWNSAPGQPGYDEPSISWVGEELCVVS
eukprot:5336645-Lingulodinium_polyedra.AAC.1